MDLIHRNDCATHNAPARGPDPCDCGVELAVEDWGGEAHTFADDIGMQSAEHVFMLEALIKRAFLAGVRF